MDADGRRLNDTTEAIIGCAYRVSNTLGCGFLEKVYENALAIEIKKAGLRVVQQARIEVTYEGHVVGEYCADLLVEACVIVELKAAKALRRGQHGAVPELPEGDGLEDMSVAELR